MARYVLPSMRNSEITNADPFSGGNTVSPVNPRRTEAPAAFSMPRRQRQEAEPIPLINMHSTVTGVGAGGSYTARLKALAALPNRASADAPTPPPKPVNVSSEEDFPSLGGKSSPVKNTSWSKGNSFAYLAKGWAERDEEDRLAEQLRIAEEERQVNELNHYRTLGSHMNSHPNRNVYIIEGDEDDDYYDYDRVPASSHDGWTTVSKGHR